MVLCLLIGDILLIAVSISFPMYKAASMSSMLLTEMEKVPGAGRISATMTVKQQTRQAQGLLDEHFDNAQTLLGTPTSVNMRIYEQVEAKTSTDTGRNDVEDIKLRLSAMTGMEAHINVIAGSLFTPGQPVVEAIVSRSFLIQNRLLIGDVITFPNVDDENTEPVQVKITGVFSAAENDDYWLVNPGEYRTNLFIHEQDFSKLFLSGLNKSVMLRQTWYVCADEKAFSAYDTDTVAENTKAFVAKANELGAKGSLPGYIEVFESFTSKSNRVMASLLILEVPVIVLLCAFLLMISGQLLSMERSEISVLKSRGASGRQIFSVYLLQSLLLSLISAVAAFPLGALICRALGSASAFLEFANRRTLGISFTAEVFIYAIAAVAVCILVMTLPVISYSKVSIVNLKQSKGRQKGMIWQRLGLDFIVFAVSIYGYYMFNGQRQEMTVRVMSGAPLDPLLYLSSSLFILGAALISIRLWPWLIRLLFLGVKKAVKPGIYVSFLQVLRTGRKQMFVMVFLVLTVSLGMFGQTVARTILSNAENNTRYRTGADVVLEEKWQDNEAAYKAGYADEIVYVEPDYARYYCAKDVNAVARVLKKSGSYEDAACDVMAVRTNEFANVVHDDGLNEYALIDYLNVLSTAEDHVLLSENFRRDFGVRLGERIKLRIDGKLTTFTVCGFVEYFPTYVASSVNLLGEGGARTEQNYLAVANLAFIQDRFGTTPYELWMDVDDENGLRSYIKEEGINIVSYSSMSEQLRAIREDTLFQGTGGILTISFIVTLILCITGFLLYWILSIRERELLFGVFRAMGMSRKGIIQMLVNEQVLSGVIFCIAGAGIGAVAGNLFVPLIQIAYTADNQVLPMELITRTSDSVRLAVIIVCMFVVCMAVLAKQVFSMKITYALKLGED